MKQRATDPVIDAKDPAYYNAVAVEVKKENNVAKTTGKNTDNAYVVLDGNRANNITIDVPNLDVETLKEMALEAYNNYEDSSLVGSFTTFGFPHVKIGDIVQLKISAGSIEGYDANIEGLFYVDKVIRTVSTEWGSRQIITIGPRYYSAELKEAVDASI